MSPRRALVVVATLAALTAAACAPGPSLEAADAPTTTAGRTTPTTTTPAPPPTTTALGPTEGPPPGTAPDLFPVAPEDVPPLDRVDGRIAFHGADAAIRSGAATIDLDTGTLPAQPTWSRDGSRLAVVSLEGRQARVDVFDGETGTLLASEPAQRRYFFLSWSHDGERIAGLGPGVDDNGDARTVLDLLSGGGALLHADVAEATSLFVAWDPDRARLAAHADDRLLRIDGDGTTTDLGSAGGEFFAPKWIPGTDEILHVADVEGTPLVARRSVDANTLRTLGEAQPRLGLSVNPDGRVAAISHNFDTEEDPVAERTGLSALAQTTEGSSGSVQILDLETGERVDVFTGFTLWVEWNPQGTRLLIYEANPTEGTGTWWVHEHRPGQEPTPALEIVAFEPTPIFLESYLVFGDQFIESPRLWSPDGSRFVYAELSESGSLIRTADAAATFSPGTIGAGEVGFWSPPR